MKKAIFLFLLIICSYPVLSQKSNVALLFHTNNHPDFEFLDKQADMIKDDLLFIYGFRTSPYKNYTKPAFFNSVANACAVDTTQLLVYIAGISLVDPDGNPYVMLAETDSTEFQNMLSYSELFNSFQDCKVKNLLVVMDVANAAEHMKSRTEELILQEPLQPDSTITKEDFIDKKMAFKSRTFVAKSATTLEPTGRYTHFSSKFMEALRNYGGNDGILNLYELKGYMENLENVPLMGAFKENETGGDFIMIAL